MATNKVLKAVFGILVLVLAVTFVFGFLWFIPKWQVDTYLSSEDFEEKKESVELENDTRRTWAQILGGVFFLITAYFTWRRVTSSEKNVIIAQEGQITERFTKAIDQIGDKEHLEVRLGGIYALERIARDSKKDHWTIMEILSAYVRVNAPWRGKAEHNKEKSMREGKKSKEAPESSQTLTDIPIVPADVETIITVLRRRTVAYEKGENRHIDLHETYLMGANFFKAPFDDSIFTRANLSHANLSGAYFSGADLERAFLKEGNLRGATLQGVNLSGANLSGANLKDAILSGADLSEANLSGAFLWGTNLEGAKLIESILAHAILEEANLSGADLSEADLEKADLRNVNLQGADLSATNLQKVKNLTLIQLSKVKTLYQAKLDINLIKKIKEKYPNLLTEPKSEE